MAKVLCLNVNAFGGRDMAFEGFRRGYPSRKAAVAAWDELTGDCANAGRVADYILEEDPDLAVLPEHGAGFHCSRWMEGRLLDGGYSYVSDRPHRPENGYNVTLGMYAKEDVEPFHLPGEHCELRATAVLLDGAWVLGAHAQSREGDGNRGPVACYWKGVIDFVDSHLGEPVAVVGDLNVHLGGTVQHGKLAELERRGMRDVWTDVLGLPGDEPTFFGSGYRLDRVLASGPLLDGRRVSMRVDRKTFEFTDHAGIVFEY